MLLNRVPDGQNGFSGFVLEMSCSFLVLVALQTLGFGGKLLTTPIAGRPVDEGADAFLARVPEAIELCDELGLRPELVSPATGVAYVWSRGELRRLPDRLVLGVPTDLDALAATGIVSEQGVARAAADLDGGWDDAGRGAGDESVGALIRRRLGDEVLERLVDPLLGGINAGDTDRLSLAAGAPQLASAAAAAGGGSLIAALRAQRDAAQSTSAPVFFTLPGGLGRLVDAIVDSTGADLRLGASVERLVRGAGGWDVNGEHVAAVIVTAPAPAAATLLREVAPAAAAAIAAIEYASVALVTMAVPAATVGRRLDGSGFLVPRGEGMLLTACSWATTKWAHLAQPDGTVVLRASVGRLGDHRALALDDGALVAKVCQELATTMGLGGEPSEVRVSRWPASFPQYEPGHLDRVAAIDAALARDAPGVVVAGAAYRGLGIPACIRQGREAARRLLALVG